MKYSDNLKEEPYMYAVKNVPVKMLKVWKLWDYKGTITAPWWWTQDFNKDSYFVLADNEVYVVQQDEKTGLPIWYEKYSS